MLCVCGEVGREEGRIVEPLVFRAPKKNTSHGKEVLLQDTTHLIQRPCYQRGRPCQDPAGNRTTRRPPDHRKETQTQWYCRVSRSSGLAKTILQGIVKGEEDKADRGRGGKTTSGNGQAWSSPSPTEQRRKLVVVSSVVPRLRSRAR